MTEQESKNDKQSRPQLPEGKSVEQLGVAGESLSEALRISFAILKIIMAVLIGEDMQNPN